jgi:hypothetical protein
MSIKLNIYLLYWYFQQNHFLDVKNMLYTTYIGRTNCSPFYSCSHFKWVIEISAGYILMGRRERGCVLCTLEDGFYINKIWLMHVPNHSAVLTHGHAGQFPGGPMSIGAMLIYICCVQHIFNV